MTRSSALSVGLTVITLCATVAQSLTAQPSPRRATNLAALMAHPGFYHLRPVVAVGEVSVRENGERRLANAAGSLRVIFKGTAPDGLSEVRGEFWDLGRLNSDDPRLAGYDLRAAFQIDPDAAWPRPGQVLAIVATAITPAPPPLTASIRAIVLHPERYLDQKVTVIGQFAGRNLLGDLPDAPAQSQYDFVLRSADAAIWVTNLRPRGRDFELSLDGRIDTGRWLQVSGTLQQGRGLQWLNAQAGALTLTKPPTDTAIEEPIRVAAAPPPEVVFSAPLDGETDVATSTNLRVQFSRDIDPASFKGRVRATYAAADAATDAAAPEIPLTTSYLPGNRVLEIRFVAPLERFRRIRVELGEGIVGADKQRLAPAVISFTTGV